MHTIYYRAQGRSPAHESLKSMDRRGGSGRAPNPGARRAAAGKALPKNNLKKIKASPSKLIETRSEKPLT